MLKVAVQTVLVLDILMTTTLVSIFHRSCEQSLSLICIQCFQEVSHVHTESYCKTLYFRCIVISRLWNVEISLHINLAFSQHFTSIYQASDGQTEFSWVFNFAILS